ncbi:hypothetical protein CYLTODRAFT_349720 [Cylindrobasidium torrendii FP15055 ss-10]|uniref:FIST domain-containing protein n=1 Tax=Cylindrobasidium torrendii FP15055 ss-10 TaxID=1314674 RepID=A0A0D7BI56_9AGAR|nr:hypothetical protein CYLTODRAFT_349720 [Cylindrobasidium torrendii FP15055 ss-10]
MPVHCSTIISRSSSQVLAYLSRLHTRYPRHTLLFALSPNFPAPELSQLVTQLTTLCPTSIGCLSAPTHSADLISCSLAILESETCIPFRSSIAGIPQPQVGRWHSYRKKDEKPERPDWPNVWGRKEIVSTPLPLELQHLSPKDVSALLYFTDASPQGLTASFEAFPHATQLGLVATSTPFITGRPFTLFHGKDVHSSGAVGLALTDRPKATSTIEFTGLESLSEPMTVTQSEGNLVNLLDGRNPTQLLLTALQKSGIDMSLNQAFKDDVQFYLMRDGGNHVYAITAGDPSRGTIALHGEEGPRVGERVQFYRRPMSMSSRIAHRTSTPSANITFLVSDDAGQVFYGTEQEGITENSFLAASENGLVFEQGSVFKIPGGIATLSLPPL